MNISIKKIAFFLVVFNALSTIKELPLKLVGFVLATVLVSLFVRHKKVRSFLKILILISSIFLLKYLFKTFLITEAGVSFVLVLSALKMWEMDNETDHFNMFLILALLECCLFLLNPTLFAFILGLVKILLFFYFILKIRNYNLAMLDAKRLFFLVTPSLLLSFLLFYTFPRFTQGFITSTNSQLLFSGSDSEISFKQLGPLNLSSNIVFKVFGLNSKTLTIPILYWRQKILWNFTNDEWRTGYLNLKGNEPFALNPFLSYRVKLLQENMGFLPVLDGTSRIVKSSVDYRFYDEFSFKIKTNIQHNADYEVQTNLLQPPLLYSALMQSKSLRLKSNKKEIVRKLILGDKILSQDLSDEKKLELVISFFKKQNFQYSLTPPFYSSLEDFILSGKLGYCSHFASAIAFMARAVDLPSRIVSGYQGGEPNPFDQSVIVREMDGHVWNEVYLKNKGWIRFDPTTLVAPGRISLGASAYNDQIDPYFNLYYYQLPKSILKFSLLNRLSLRLDSLNSGFSSNIMYFDKEKQRQVWEKILPKSWPVGWLFVLALLGSMSLFWFLHTWLNKIRINPSMIRYKKFVKRMSNQGTSKYQYESANAFRLRCISENDHLKDYIDSETNHYIRYFYE